MSTAHSWADHRLFEGPAGVVLYGVEDISLFSLDEEARRVLARWRTREPLVLESAPEPDRSVLEAFRRARILVPASERRRARARRPEPGEVPLSTLVLEVAQSCNLRCAYCYAGGGTYGGPARLLSPDRARQAARYLIGASGDLEEVTLVLFGGEPLMNLPAVRAAVEEAEAGAAGAGKRVRFSLTTNGTLLTPEAVAFLQGHRVSVSVSLDGPPDIHDANRPGADGVGSYRRALAGLARLLEAPPAPVAARVTLVPGQWGRVPEVFDHLVSLGVHEVGIAPASPVTPELLPEPEQEDALLAGFAELAERFRARAREGEVLPFSNLLDLLARIHVGAVRGAPCGAGLGYLASDTEGRLFLCHRLVGEESFRVGDLGRGVDPHRVRGCLDALEAPRRDACGGCWVRSLCRGGCHYDNHLRENVLGLAPGGSCGFIRRWLQMGVEVYGGLRREGADGLLARLGARASC